MVKTPRLKYKIRKVTTHNKSGDSFAIAVPAVVAEKFKDTYMYMTITTNGIIFESGCNPYEK